MSNLPACGAADPASPPPRGRCDPRGACSSDEHPMTTASDPRRRHGDFRRPRRRGVTRRGEHVDHLRRRGHDAVVAVPRDRSVDAEPPFHLDEPGVTPPGDESAHLAARGLHVLGLLVHRSARGRAHGRRRVRPAPRRPRYPHQFEDRLLDQADGRPSAHQRIGMIEIEPGSSPRDARQVGVDRGRRVPTA